MTLFRTRAPLATAVLATVVVVPIAAQPPNRGRPARPVVTLPDGPVRQVILGRCTACHGIDEYAYYAMGRDDWRALVERMKTARSGVVEGTKISDADLEVLLDWLVAEFGPDSKPFPRASAAK
jgi:mono/diheme cytochrome c family protein